MMQIPGEEERRSRSSPRTVACCLFAFGELSTDSHIENRFHQLFAMEIPVPSSLSFEAMEWSFVAHDLGFLSLQCRYWHFPIDGIQLTRYQLCW
jgi:hypothetical protein